MLEAAIRLLDDGGLEALTTNAVAAKAGVSIGTLYQYFQDKRALLDALADREVGALSAKVIEVMKGADAAAGERGERIRRIVRAVVGAYGGRGRAHRVLMEHSLTVGPTVRLSPLYATLTGLLTSTGVAVPGQLPRKLVPAEAFVLIHAIAGVLRALVASPRSPPLQEVEDALVGLVVTYVSAVSRMRA